MDHKTRSFKVYTSTPTNISNKNNEGFDDTTNGQEKWGEGGTTTQLMNTMVTLQKLEILEVDEHEKSNVSTMWRNLRALLTEMIYDLIIAAYGPIIEVQQVHHPVVVAQEPISFANLFSLPHLLARKTRGKKSLVDYNQSYVVTSREYFRILQQKALKREAAKAIKQQKRKKKEDKKAQQVVDSLIMAERTTQRLLNK